MQNLATKLRQDEQGFTLVELAVVMIIIGILIGGILKGQELITNARVTSTISQLEAISAAKNDFQNQYNSLPGDMDDASTRIGQCGVDACGDGSGDGVLENAVGEAPADTEEGTLFFTHLLGAGYITGMDGTEAATFGEGLPTAAVGGGYMVGYKSAAQATSNFTDANMRTGVYLVQTGEVSDVAADTGILTGLQASRIDTKLDDGVPDQGGLQADTNCVDGTTGGFTADPAISCSVAYRI